MWVLSFWNCSAVGPLVSWTGPCFSQGSALLEKNPASVGTKARVRWIISHGSAARRTQQGFHP